MWTGVGEKGELQRLLGRGIHTAEVVDRRSNRALFIQRHRWETLNGAGDRVDGQEENEEILNYEHRSHKSRSAEKRMNGGLTWLILSPNELRLEQRSSSLSFSLSHCARKRKRSERERKGSWLSPRERREEKRITPLYTFSFSLACRREGDYRER